VSDELTPAGMRHALWPFRQQVEREIRRKLKMDEDSTYVTVDRQVLAALMNNYDDARAQLAAAQPALEAANRVVRAWRALDDYDREHVWRGSHELVEALDALAGVVRDEETT
jgi:hypothetical protein